MYNCIKQICVPVIFFRAKVGDWEKLRVITVILSILLALLVKHAEALRVSDDRAGWYIFLLVILILRFFSPIGKGLRQC